VGVPSIVAVAGEFSEITSGNHLRRLLDQGRNELLPLYETVRTAERNGQKFGEALCRYRKLLRAQGNKDGLGFDAFLKKIGIARSSAYRWIGFVEGHFVPNGTRLPRSEPPRKPPNTKFGSGPDISRQIKPDLFSCFHLQRGRPPTVRHFKSCTPTTGARMRIARS